MDEIEKKLITEYNIAFMVGCTVGWDEDNDLKMLREINQIMKLEYITRGT